MSAPVAFSCTLCGDCCTGAQVVRLTDGDRRRLAAHQGVHSWADLRRLGLVNLVRETLSNGERLWRPRLRFRTRPLVQCHFLINDVGADGTYRGLCQLHLEGKPLVCRLSPLTRTVKVGDPSEQTWSIVSPSEGCPGMGRGPVIPLQAPLELQSDLTEEVRWMEWLLSWGSDVDDEAAAWRRLETWVP